jgi:uncharacterized delta-60 repeat protein
MAEDLEGRALLSVGLDPTYGFGGFAPVVVPPNTTTTSFSESLSSVALQNGQAVVVGTLTTTPTPTPTTTPTPTPTTNLIVSRYTTGGLVDSTFATNGTTTIPLTIGSVTYTVDSANDIAVQSSGKIDILAAVTPTSAPSTQEFMVAQLNSNGGLDTSFGSSGATFISFGTTASPTTDSPTSITIGPGGKIDAVGSTVSSTGTGNTLFAIAQLTSGGALDTSFNNTGTATVNFARRTSPGLFENDVAQDVVVQPNGAVVVVGSAQLTNPSGTTTTENAAAVARLNANGTLDTTFNPTGPVPGTLVYSYNLNNGSFTDDLANSVALQPNGAIVIAGTTAQENPTPTPTPTPSPTPTLPENITVTRLNPNGSFDTTFNGSGKFMLTLNQAGVAFNTTEPDYVTVLHSNNLVVGGAAIPLNSGTSASAGVLLELTPAGVPDTSYGTNGVALVPAAPTTRMFVQADGKVVYIAGDEVARTTPPTPAAATTTIITTGTGKKAKATGVTIRFNTAVNPNLLTSPTIYQVRPNGKKKVLKLKKKGGVAYNAATQTLSLTLASKTAIGKGFQVVVITSGIVGADGQVLPSTPIIITPSTT